MDAHDGSSSPSETRSSVGIWVSRSWGRALWSLVFTLAMGSNPALAQGTPTAAGAGSAQPSVGNQFSIQVMALTNGASATAMVERLVGKGYPAYVLERRQDDESTVYRVRVGDYSDRAAAEAIGRQLEDEDELDWFLVSLPSQGNTGTASASLATDGASPATPSSACPTPNCSRPATTVTSPGFTVAESGGGTSVSETGTTDTFTVVLEAQPTSDVVLTVASGDTGEATVSPRWLTFTTANWNSAQTVTGTGVDDALMDGTQTTTITVAVDEANSDDAFDPLADQTLGVSTTDDDSAGFSVTESGEGTSVSETGTTDTFTVVLEAQPTSDVVLTVASGDTGEATVSPRWLTFTTANWNSAQTVTGTGVDDALTDGTQTTTITVAVDDANSDDIFDPLADQTLGVSTTDDDSAGFSVTESGGTSVSESGTTDTFTVVLEAQPTSDVVLAVASGDTGEATVSPRWLTFTTANWNSAQTVTGTGVDDALIDGTQATTITVSVDDANSDDAFDPLADQTLGVSTTDDDSAGFSVTESGEGTSVSETGTTDTFTVVLDAQPTTNVVLMVASGDTGEATVSPRRLTFTPANWNNAQTVTGTGVDDPLTDGTQTTTITVSVDDADSDAAFDSVADQAVGVSTTDDDGQGFTVTELDRSTSVSDTATGDTLVLGSQPATGVVPTTGVVPMLGMVPTIASRETGEATVSSGSATGTNANGNNAQTVPVTTVDDSPSGGTQATTATVSVDDTNRDTAVDSRAQQTDGLVATNDEDAGITVSGDISIVEGAVGNFTVVLDALPITNVELAVTTANPFEVLTSPTALTFTTANWDSPQTVAVLAVDDALQDGT